MIGVLRDCTCFIYLLLVKLDADLGKRTGDLVPPNCFLFFYNYITEDPPRGQREATVQLDGGKRACRIDSDENSKKVLSFLELHEGTDKW